jgi:hypothetical protein
VASNYLPESLGKAVADVAAAEFSAVLAKIDTARNLAGLFFGVDLAAIGVIVAGTITLITADHVSDHDRHRGIALAAVAIVGFLIAALLAGTALGRGKREDLGPRPGSLYGGMAGLGKEEAMALVAYEVEEATTNNTSRLASLWRRIAFSQVAMVAAVAAGAIGFGVTSR